MKKILSLILVVFFIFSFSAYGATDAKSQKEFKGYGYTHKVENKIIKQGEEVSDVNLNFDEFKLTGSMKIKGESALIESEFSKQDNLNNLDYYEGKIKYHGKYYNISIVKNDEGLSAIVFNDNRSESFGLTLSKNGKNKVSKSINEFNSKLLSDDSVFNESSTNNLNEIIPYSLTPTNKTLRITHSGWSFPFVVSSGSVDGTLRYTVNVNDYDPDTQFSANSLYGVINWNTMWDGISIVNNNEYGGVLWGTPVKPPKVITTWQIGEYARETGTYYLKAYISYTALLDTVPILYTSTKQSPIY